MSQEDQLAEFHRACERRQLSPSDLKHFLKHFPTEKQKLEILWDMVREGVIFFDGRDFWVRSWLERLEVVPPELKWGEGDLLHARCFDANRSTPPRVAPRKGGEASIPAGL